MNNDVYNWFLFQLSPPNLRMQCHSHKGRQLFLLLTNSCSAKSVAMWAHRRMVAKKVKEKGNDERRREKRTALGKKEWCKEERKKGNERQREMEGLIHGIIVQTYFNCTRNKNCSKMALGELKDDVNPLPGSSSVLSLPENHTSINSCKMCVLSFWIISIK